jgi:tetratricopeptide (TPR) repeat protein
MENRKDLLNKINDLLSKENTQDVSMMILRSLLYSKVNETDKAIADITKAIALDPKNITAYYVRCHFNLDRQLYDLAKRDYARAFRLENSESEPELIKKYTDEFISTMKMENEFELHSIQKLANYESAKAYLELMDHIDP